MSNFFVEKYVHQVGNTKTEVFQRTLNVILVERSSSGGVTGVTNLGWIPASDSAVITSSSGQDVILTAATDSHAGLLTSIGKMKLDGIEEGAQVNRTDTINAVHINGNTLTFTHVSGSTFTIDVPSTANLSYTPSRNNGVVSNDAGSGFTIPAADSNNAGLLTPDEKEKLAGIESKAEVNPDDYFNAASISGSVFTLTRVNGSTEQFTLGGSGGGLSSVNLGYTSSPSNGTVTNTGGSNAIIPAATTSAAGLLTSVDKGRLNLAFTSASIVGNTLILNHADGGTQSITLPSSGGSGTATNLSALFTTNSVTIASDTGNDAVIPAATSTSAGVFTSDNRSTLNTISSAYIKSTTVSSDGNTLTIVDQAGNSTTFTPSGGTPVTPPTTTTTLYYGYVPDASSITQAQFNSLQSTTITISENLTITFPTLTIADQDIVILVESTYRIAFLAVSLFASHNLLTSFTNVSQTINSTSYDTRYIEDVAIPDAGSQDIYIVRVDNA